jgi:hypothetical protein
MFISSNENQPTGSKSYGGMEQTCGHDTTGMSFLIN